MPNWKKLVVSGSDAHLNSLNVATSVTASFLKGDGSALTNITASYFAEGLVTASSASDTITFTKDNGDTFDVSIISASYALTASHAQNLTVSGSIAGADYIDFTTTASVPYSEGRLFYDYENGALAFYNEEAEITLQIGQEFYKRVFNNTGGVISNGTPVRISGSQGDYPYVWPAISTNIYSGSYDSQENKVVGVATHNIGINEVGYVTELGVVRGIDTTAFAAGDRLYLQTGSAGFRNTPPPFPFDIIPIGEVLRSQANGFIEVRTSDPITSENISGIINIETEVISDESVTIQKGTPVHVVSEGDGPVPRVKIAKANDSNLMPATFVVEEDILSGSQGTALSIGYIYDVDTSAFAVGDVIYVAPNGGYTNQKPTGSDLIQNLGVVLKVSATEGSGFVYGSGRSNDVPNIPENYLWIGNASGVATPVSTGSLSGSFLLNTTDTLTGDLTVTGRITAEEFHTEFVSSSIIYRSGSTKFGDTSDDVHQFTGSLAIDGSSLSRNILKVTGTTTNPLARFESSTNRSHIEFDNNTTSGSIGVFAATMYFDLDPANSFGGPGAMIFAISGSQKMRIEKTGNVGIGTLTPGELLTVAGNISGSGNLVIEGDITGSSLQLSSVVNAGTDTDKFLVLDSAGNIDFRTGAEVLSDIGGTNGTLENARLDALELETGSIATEQSFQDSRLNSIEAATGSYLLNTTDTFTGVLNVTGSALLTGSLAIQSGSISLKDDYGNIVIGEGASAETPTQLNSTLNVVIGGNAGNPDDLSIAKTGNVIIGDSAKMPRGQSNVLVGRNVMSNSGTSLSNSNVAVGAYAMQNQNGAAQSVVIGASAGTTLSSGDGNILVGYLARVATGTDNNNIVIGHAATGKGSNTTYIGKPGTTTHTYLEGLITGSSLEIGGDITGSNALFNGTVNATGDVVAYYSSDERFKDNIVEIENAVEKVESIRGVEFDWNDKQDTYTGHDIGVIAQEVEAILPEIVATRDNGYKAVKYEKLTALLLTAVKELSERVKTLEGK